MLTRVAQGVLVHRSELLENNAVAVEGEGGVLLVDPGVTESELSCLARDLADAGRQVVAGFATHPDWDHVLWHPALGDVPRYGTARCAADMRDQLARADWEAVVAEGLPPEIAGEVPMELFGLVTGLPVGAERVPWGGPPVRVVEHRAHAPGHAALSLEESGVLVAGDMLSDVLVPMLDLEAADPVGDYLEALELLEAVAGDVVVPGHGSVAEGDEVRARIEADRAYVVALRERRRPADPRIGPEARPGWEWVADLHEGQAEHLARKG